MTARAASSWRTAGTSLAGAAAMITVITITSRVLGFARWMVQARTVGYGEVGTAYTSANTLPNVLFEVAAGGALAGALIPLLAVPIARGLRRDVDRIVSAMLGWALAILIPLALVVVVIARPVAAFFLDESAGSAQLDLAALFLRVFAVQIPLYGVGVVLTGALQAQKRFFWPAFAPVLSTLTVMVAYLVFAATASGAQDAPEVLPTRAAAWLAWGTTAGVAAMSLPLLIPTHRSGIRLRPALRFPPGVARRAIRLALAGIGALLAQQLAVLVTVWLSNKYGGTGAFPVFQYTQAVYLLPYAVLAVPLATSAFPRLAEHAGERDLGPFARLAAGTTRGVVLMSGFGAAVLGATAGAVTWVFIGVGTGSAEVMAAMTGTLTAMAPGLVGFAVLFHVSRALYALERARSAVLAAAAGWTTVVVVSIAVTFALVPSGTDGPRTLVALGIGNSAGMLVAGLIALVALRRAAGPEALTGLARSAFVVTIGGIAAAVAGRLVADGFAHWWTRWFGTLVDGVPGIGTSIMAGGAAVIVVVVVVGSALWIGDRQTVRVVLPRQLRRPSGKGAA